MDEPDQPSERLVEQRMRNRVMESLVALSEGDEGVRSVGVGEYVNQFFDFIDDDIPWRWREWSTFTPEEVERLDEVHGLLNEACRQTPRELTDDEFIASGWPTRIQPTAKRALEVMTARGRFSEDVEEEQPSATRIAVFVIDGHDIELHPDAASAAHEIEGYDANDLTYFGADGAVYAATVEGPEWGPVTLHPTADNRLDELVRLLRAEAEDRGFLLPAGTPDHPEAIWNAVLAAQQEQRKQRNTKRKWWTRQPKT